jgi:hypothetical protein
VSTDNPKFRIISAEPAVAERMVNELWRDYQMLSVNVQPFEGKPLVTVILVHKSEVPRQQQSPIMVPVGALPRGN